MHLLTSPWQRDLAHLPRPDLQSSVRRLGEELFDLMEAAGPPSLFSKKGFYGTLMEWAMRDERFKTQLFRFVDVLPTLASSSEVSRHLKEYLGDGQARLAPACGWVSKRRGEPPGCWAPA